MTTAPAIEHHYQNMIFDSARWQEFSLRDDDVLVCTSYKAGTTWTQMVCALIIHGTPNLPAPMSELSPWLDMRVTSIEDISARLQAQTHRRIIKTHTALDGLPYHPSVTYMVCSRDPRDVFMSLQNHMTNGNPLQFAKLLLEQGVELEMPEPLPDDINERFRLWITTGTFPWEQDGLPYWSHFRHAETFWKHRHRDNIQFLHYSDMSADLDREMRRVAAILGVTPDEAVWPDLVKAATFGEMKANADRTAPDTNKGLWLDNSQFFNKGSNAQWRGVLSEESLALYEEITRARYAPDLLAWIEGGAASGVDPKAA